MDLYPLLERSVEQKASDLHLSPGLPPLVRIDGDLQSLEGFSSLTAEVVRELVYSLLDEKQGQALETDLELDFVFSLDSNSTFRIHAFHQEKGLAAAFRILAGKPPSLEDLELPPFFKTLLEPPKGLIMVTGPTGSGKSTTLAALVDYLNAHYPYHIITIEDPIEYKHTSHKSLISQRQVHRDTHDFARALQAALREDPDVILVGEMRELETLRLALRAAETGHVVLASLHTSSASRSINRIIDVFPAGEKQLIRNMLAESLTAVIYQTLLKRTTGGRVPAFEVLRGTPAIRNLIREDKIAQMYTVMQTGKERGMITLEQSLQELVTKKLITQDSLEKRQLS